MVDAVDRPLPPEAAALLANGVEKYRAGDPRAAADIFATVLEHVPDHPDALRLRGLALVRAGEVTAALPLLARARRLAWMNPLVHAHYGIGLLKAERPAQAAAVLRRAVTMQPDNAAFWLNFSGALLALGKAPAARAAARRALALTPESPEAHYALGLAERMAGNPAGARAAFAAAARLAPGFAEAWINLGLAAFQQGATGEANRAMEQALAADPFNGAAEANLAGFMLLQGDHEAAMDRLRAVLERDPSSVPARLNLANAVLLDREGAAALALLEGAVPKRREGAHWRAQRAMALLLLRRDAEAAAELDAIAEPYDAAILVAWRRLLLAERAGDEAESLAQAERLAGFAAHDGAALLEHRILGNFELAAFRGRRGEHGRSFAHWNAGHALLRRVQPFSRERFAALVDTSIAAYDSERFRNGPRAARSDPAPVFIVGMPRSGTSLAEQVLAAHPMVYGGGERTALHRTIGQLAGLSLDPETIARLAACDAATLDAAAETYLADLHALTPDARRITDKMPGNALHLGFLATLLPGARVILCRRDPRDIGLSIFQLRFFGYHPYAHDLGDLGWYMGQHERLMAHWRAVLPIPLLELALTDWVDDFNGTLTRVLDFLELPYDPACERFFEQRRRVRTASAEQVRQPINARGIGRWRRYATWLGPMLDELKSAGLIEAEETASGG